MSLNGNNDEANGYNSVAKNGESANVNFIKSMLPPIGSIIPWAKTFDIADSGTTDGTTANKLIQSGQNFLTTCAINMIVYNTTDTTWAYITAVDSNTQLSLSADIMDNGENFTIYTTPTLPDAWAECDGSVLSDADSPYNGATLPDLNSTQSFARGSSTSGSTGGTDTLDLGHTHAQYTFGAGNGAISALSSTGNETPDLSNVASLPTYYEVVFIMRVK